MGREQSSGSGSSSMQGPVSLVKMNSQKAPTYRGEFYRSCQDKTDLSLKRLLPNWAHNNTQQLCRTHDGLDDMMARWPQFDLLNDERRSWQYLVFMQFSVSFCVWCDISDNIFLSIKIRCDWRATEKTHVFNHKQKPYSCYMRASRAQGARST